MKKFFLRHAFFLTFVFAVAGLILLYFSYKTEKNRINLVVKEDDGGLYQSLSAYKEKSIVSDRLFGGGVIGICVLNYTSTSSVVERFLDKLGVKADVNLESFYSEEWKWSIVRVGKDSVTQIVFENGCVGMDLREIGVCEQVGGKGIVIKKQPPDSLCKKQRYIIYRSL